MKVCIVLPCNIYIAPFYSRYVKLLSEFGSEFDLVYWNRTNIEEETFAKRNFSYMEKDQLNSGSYNKIFKYLGFAKFVKRHLKNNDYDRILILGSYAGIMVLLASYLKRNYKRRYWLDIRDFTFENIKPYYLGMKKAIEHSAFTVISSEGYLDFLPVWNYIVSHNMDKGNIESSLKKREGLKKDNNEIRISFIGLIRYYEENKKLLQSFKNDKRFKLQYYGANSEVLEQYCINEDISNTEFHGRFQPDKTSEFYQKTDLINNVYGSQGIELTTALSNKLYFAAGLKIPILVSKGTLMEKIVKEYHFGYAVDFEDPNSADNIFKWYSSIDWKMLENGCSTFLKKVQQDEEKFNESLKKFLKI